MQITARNADYGETPCHPELLLVILTGIGHVALQVASDGLSAAESLSRPYHVYNLVVSVLWGVYLLLRALRAPGALRAWGFRAAGFLPSLGAGALLAAAAAVPMVLHADFRHTLNMPSSFWLVLAIYPLWGLAQQFALQALITRNLREAIPRPASRVAAASVLFSAAHFPDFPLMALTLAAGVAFTAIFEKYRNLWAVGLLHGILGAMAYYLVLGRDPGAVIADFLK